jgi:hypothetical protein
MGVVGGTIIRAFRNILDSSLSSASASLSAMDSNGRGMSAVGVHLTPSKQCRRSNSKDLSKQRAQGRCRVCGSKSTNVCSLCLDMEPSHPGLFFCHSRTNRDCFSKHVLLCHDDETAAIAMVSFSLIVACLLFFLAFFYFF